MNPRLAIFVGVIQSILWAAHGFVYASGLRFLGVPGPAGQWILRGSFGLLSISFTLASILAFRTSNPASRSFYTAAAGWLGLLSFLFFASMLAWGVEGAARLLGRHPDRGVIGRAAAGLALLASGWAIANASWLRVRRLSVRLDGIPDRWKGRVAGIVSDLHLGHVRNRRFLGRVLGQLSRHRPDIVWVPGDLYDGTHLDAGSLAELWKGVGAPFGVFFVTGNHEEFGDSARFLEPLARSGVRVLRNELVEVDGLPIVGIDDGVHRNSATLEAVLDRIPIDGTRASILLAHAPIHLEQAERKGFSLQVSGHTHGGQFVPFTWIVSWIYGAFAHGLHRWGRLWVCTSSGAGTWGPPMRLGSDPEIVLLRFE